MPETRRNRDPQPNIDRRAALLRLRICVDCAAAAAVPGYQKCAECRAKRAQANRDRKAARIAAGVCWRCGGKLDDPKFKRCAKCRQRAAQTVREAYHLRRLNRA